MYSLIVFTLVIAILISLLVNKGHVSINLSSGFKLLLLVVYTTIYFFAELFIGQWLALAIAILILDIIAGYFILNKNKMIKSSLVNEETIARDNSAIKYLIIGGLSLLIAGATINTSLDTKVYKDFDTSDIVGYNFKSDKDVVLYKNNKVVVSVKKAKIIHNKKKNATSGNKSTLTTVNRNTKFLGKTVYSKTISSTLVVNKN